MVPIRLKAFLLALSMAAVAASQARPTAASLPLAADTATVTHVLNRLTFGPRPDEVDRVRQIGLAAWIDRQLHPERIDDRAADERVPRLQEPPDFSDPKDLRRFAK